MNGSKGKIDAILKNLAEGTLSPSTGLFTEHIHSHACLVKLKKLKLNCWLSFYFAFILAS